MTLAKFLLENKGSTMNLGYLSVERADSILEELENEDPYSVFYMKVFKDGSAFVEGLKLESDGAAECIFDFTLIK